MTNKQPKTLQTRNVAPKGEYPALPEPFCNAHSDADSEWPDMFSACQMRAYVDADRAMRAAQPAGAQQPGVAGCTRSHPHENMDSACSAKAAIAEMQNMAARGAEATAHDLERFVAMLAAAPTTQPAPQQEAQEPVAWYVTGCGRLMDEDEAKAEARHIGGTARAIPLYTAPQAYSHPARDERDDFEKVFPRPSGCIRCGTGYASTDYSNWAAHTHCERWQGWQARAARAPADSVTAPVGEGVAGPGGKCMGLRCMASAENGYAHSRECIDEAGEVQGWKPTAEDYATCGPSAQATDSVPEDAARLEFEMQHGSAIAAARKQGATHD